MKTDYIGLGSNLDNPSSQLKQALRELTEIPQTRLLAASSFYLSVAIGPEQPDYTNAVAKLESSLEPLALLDALQAIEQAHFRVRKEHWGPRTLDLDILLIDDLTLNTERLQVPHPFMLVRNFVLFPLLEIAPDLILPSGLSLADAAQACPNQGIRQLGREEI